MAIEFQTSFDHYTTATQRFQALSTSGGSAAIGATGRNSTNGWRATGNAGGGGNIITLTKAIAPVATTYLGFAMRVNTLPSPGHSAVIFMDLRDTGTSQVNFYLNPAGTVSARNGAGTILGTSSWAMLPSVWYHFEFKTFISDASGTVDMLINEISQLSLTSKDTKTTAIAQVTEFVVGIINLNIASTLVGDLGLTTLYDFDDIVYNPSAYIGDVQVRAFLPTGIGATNQWTPNTGTSATATDDNPPNDDTDYISTATVNDITLLTYGTIPTTSTIVAVVPIPYAKKTSAGTAQIQSTVRLGGVNYPGTAKAPSDSAYEFHPDILMVSPATGLAFTPTEWNSPIEVGPKRNA